jgi:hypothetical protein
MAEVRQKGRAATPSFRTASQVLLTEVKSYSPGKSYDIFLSHCFKDAEAVLGVSETLKGMGYSVYVDWLEDSQLSRDQVSKATAEILKARMGGSKALFFASSDQSGSSRWMPWELGYFDGLRSKVAILPVVETGAYTDAFTGQEYLGLYLYVTKGSHPVYYHETLIIRTSSTSGKPFSEWVAERGERTLYG